MALISTDEFRERFDIDSEITDRRIEPHIGSASRRLKAWVGASQYAAALAAAVAGQDDDVDLVNDLKSAEAHLTYHFAIYGMNSPLSSKGVVTQSRTSEGGREIRMYLEPDKTAALAGYFLELAREIAEPYITEDAASGIGVIGSSSSCPQVDVSCEGVTRW